MRKRLRKKLGRGEFESWSANLWVDLEGGYEIDWLMDLCERHHIGAAGLGRQLMIPVICTTRDPEEARQAGEAVWARIRDEPGLIRLVRIEVQRAPSQTCFRRQVKRDMRRDQSEDDRDRHARPGGM